MNLKKEVIGSQIYLNTYNMSSSNEKILLHEAVKNSDLENINELLVNGADPNVVDKQNRTALFFLEKGGSIADKIIELLVEYGIDLNIREKETDWTVLIYAIWRREKSLVQKYLKMGAEVNTKDSYGNNELYYAVAILQGWIGRSSRPLYTFQSAVPITTDAAQTSTVQSFEVLLPDEEEDLFNIINLLLDYGVDPRALNNKGETVISKLISILAFTPSDFLSRVAKLFISMGYLTLDDLKSSGEDETHDMLRREIEIISQRSQVISDMIKQEQIDKKIVTDIMRLQMGGKNKKKLFYKSKGGMTTPPSTPVRDDGESPSLWSPTEETVKVFSPGEKSEISRGDTEQYIESDSEELISDPVISRGDTEHYSVNSELNEEDIYNSTNFSLEEKLLFAVNTGNAYYVIELIGNGALTKESYKLLLASALSRKFDTIVQLLLSAYEEIFYDLNVISTSDRIAYGAPHAPKKRRIKG